MYLSSFRQLALRLPFSTYKPPDLNLFIRRLAGFLFDWYIGTTVFFGLCKLMLSGIGIIQIDNFVYPHPDYIIFNELTCFCYFVGFCALPFKATPGMLLTGIRLTGAGTKQVNFCRIACRYALFSVWFLYVFRRVLFAQLLATEPLDLHELISIVRQQLFWIEFAKHGLLFILFIVPYSMRGYTLPDYLFHIRVIKRENNSTLVT